MNAISPLLPAGVLGPDVQFHTSAGFVPYPEATAAMEARVAAIRAKTAPECVWFLEHPPLYTAGSSANDADLLDKQRFPVHRTGRGGQYTYHGPGQRVAYVMLDLQRPRACGKADIRCYVHNLEEWVIRTLGRFGIKGERRDGRVGIWVARNGDGRSPSIELPAFTAGNREDKVGAIGVRVRHWISYHGIALNVSPDLSHFSGIVPCGISQHGVTSLRDLGVTASLAEVDQVLIEEFKSVFVPL